jgi:hypothetical protein
MGRDKLRSGKDGDHPLRKSRKPTADESVQRARSILATAFSITNRAASSPFATCQTAILGNPFRPYPAPDHWPSIVVQLAEALYNGENCTFALHDALLETVAARSV